MSTVNTSGFGLENKQYFATNVTMSGVGGSLVIPSATLSFYPTGMEKLDVQKIIYNGRTTIVYWSDGTKNVSTCSTEDVFDEAIGFSQCLLKKMFGKKIHGKKLYRRMIERAERH